jgi:hypothetical protein
MSHLCICQALSVHMNRRQEPLRRNTEGVGPFRVPPNPSLLTRNRFKKAVTTTVAAIRLKKLLEKKPDEDHDDAVSPITSTDQRPICPLCHHAFDFSRAPQVVRGCFPCHLFLSTYTGIDLFVGMRKGSTDVGRHQEEGQGHDYCGYFPMSRLKQRV